jgi:xylan 1,4-beta-xylosidase
LDQYGNRQLYLSPDLQSVCRTATSQRPLIALTSKPKLPVYITEWSASYSPRDPIHDSYFSAPFILEQLRNSESVEAMSYWTFTDVFEENGPPTKPFHGGFGLINYQGIRKPAFWAYQFLSRLGNTELRNTDSSSYVCSDGHGGIQVLFWNLTPPTDGGKISNQDYFFKPHPAVSGTPVAIKLSHLKSGKYRQQVFRIGYQENDPYSRYLEMGAPFDLSREAVSQLKAISSGKPVSESVVQVKGSFECSLPLATNEVCLVTLTSQR